MLIFRQVRVVSLSLGGALVAAMLLLGAAVPVQAQGAPSGAVTELGSPTGPVRLRQNQTRTSRLTAMTAETDLLAAPKPPREPDEFEMFVSGLAGYTVSGRPAVVRRFGSDLAMQADIASDAGEPLPLVPPDYLVKPGDQLLVSLWGSVDAELDVTVDRSGRVTLPRLGAVVVAGTRFADLADVLRRRAAQTFKNFELSVSMGELRGVRVFVTGFVQRPGAYNVNSLSTISQALFKAGGPSSAGSFRQITLRRQGQAPLNLDLYDLLVKGVRKDDRVLQSDDVLHVGPVGIQVALIGSVNQQAIFELKPGETLRDLMQMAGGLSPVADDKRLALQRLGERDNLRVVEWLLPESANRVLVQGDVLRAISSVSAIGSLLPQNKRVRVEGEVVRPGTYILPPGSGVQDALAAAGGLTSAAFMFATELERESVRIAQQQNYERALRDLETSFARSAASQRSTNAEEIAARESRDLASSRLIERLRALRPTGRIVLDLSPTSTELPALALEDGDRLYLPSRGSTVGVFGSVFSVGNYLYGEHRTLGDYLRLAGGTTRGADKDSVFVIRANGSVISESQSSGWLTSGKLQTMPALPGDTLFVPEENNKTSFVQNVKDWTQILFQFGLGVAAFKTLGN